MTSAVAEVDEYASGFGEVQKALDAANAKGGSYSKTNYFKMESGTSVIVRFISDRVIPVPVFSIPPIEVVDAEGKKSMTSKFNTDVVDCEFLKGAKRRDNVIKTHPVFMKTAATGKSAGKKFHPNHKDITLGVLVKRHEVNNDEGITVIEDLVESVKEEKDGKEVTVKKVVPYFVNFSNFVFWKNLSGIANRHGLTKFDLEIKKDGDGLKTTYGFTILPPASDEDNKPFKEAGGVEAYYKAKLGDDIPNLIEWIEYKGSEETYQKFVYPHLPGYVPPVATDSADDSEGSEEGSEEEASTETPSVTDVAAQIKKRLAAK